MYSEAIKKNVFDLYTLILPSGEEGTELLVLTDIKIKGDDAYTCWRDITYSQPMYMSLFDLLHLLGEYYIKDANLWTIDDIEALVHHED